MTGSSHFEVIAPDGRRWTVELDQARMTIGRGTSTIHPDIVLQPDPQAWISRLHCAVEADESGWWVIDNASRNGTLIRDHGDIRPVVGRVRLSDASSLLILADIVADERPRYWELVFSDRDATRRPAEGAKAAQHGAETCLEYDWVGARLYRCEEGRRTEVVANLGANAHRLVRYMAKISGDQGGTSVAASYDELISAVWGPPDEWPAYRTYTIENLRDLVSTLRRRIEPDPDHPTLLQTEPGLGYRLVFCLSPR